MVSKLLQFLLPFPREFLEYPGARTLRTSFLKKLMDTFFVFAGKIRVTDPEPGNKEDFYTVNNPLSTATNPRMGIFDYLLLGIPQLTAKLFYAAKYIAAKGSKKLAVGVATLGFITNIILQPLRYLVAGAATLLVFFPVGAIHLISRFLGSETCNTALAIKDNLYGETLKKYLERTKMSADDLRLTSIEAQNNERGRTITLTLTAKGNVRSEEEQSEINSLFPESFVFELDQTEAPLSEITQIETTQAEITHKREPTFITTDVDQQKGFHAILALNMFKADSRLRDKNNLKLKKESDRTIVDTVLAI